MKTHRANRMLSLLAFFALALLAPPHLAFAHGGDEPRVEIEAVMIHATFPTVGECRLWIEFIDDGQLKRVPLSVIVR